MSDHSSNRPHALTAWTLALTAGLATASAGELTFKGIEAPATDSEKRAIRVSPSVWIDGRDHPVAYHTILRSGDRSGSGTFGQLIDQNADPLPSGQGGAFSSYNDFSSLIPAGETLFLVSHFEETPGAIYLTRLNQDKSTGELSASSTAPIDLSSAKGVWNPCAGSVTPWGTHLGSEEYEPDAAVRDPVTGDIDNRFLAMAATPGT